MNIAILSCNTGGGHNSAAATIKEYFDSKEIYWLHEFCKASVGLVRVKAEGLLIVSHDEDTLLRR